MGVRKDTVRRFALEMPESVELETWETPTFRVRKKIFAMFSDEERTCWVKSTHDEQQALVAMDPDTFFVPPYVGPSGWVGVRFAGVDRDEVEFRYGGQAHLAYPENPDALSDEEWADFLFMRDNPKGPWAERWLHAHGCRRWFNAIRDTATYEMIATYRMGEEPPA